MRRRSLLAAVAAMSTAATLTLLPLLPAPAAAVPPGDPQPSQAASGDPAALAAQAADQAVSSGLDDLRKGPDETFWRKSVTPGAGGMFYVSYDRTYKGLPVVGGDAVVVTDSQGHVRDTAAASGPAPAGLSTRARVSAERATETARSQLSQADGAEPPRLVVLAWGGRPRLAWEVVVSGLADGNPSKKHVFVDARTGAVADSYDEVRAGTGQGYYNGNVTIDTSQSAGTYRMVDTSRPGIQCGGQNGQPYTGTDDAWGNGSGTNLETACVDALYGVQRQWNMLREWLGRNGIDGQGRGFPARVGLNAVNAYWNGSYTNFGHSQDNQRQATPIDVVAHEFGHAIFQTTPGGAGSGNENGGINEGTGDIFGALTEHYAANPGDPPDYEVGEEVNLVGDGPIRYMYNPSRAGDPNCYSSSIPSTEVHAAAGPLNHWFYLLAEGSNPGGGKPSSPICTGGPSSVTGIGIEKAGKIFMGALARKTSTWRYVNVRTASLAAAVELYGATGVECATTKAAWNAVSVPAQSGEPACSTPTQDFSMSVSPTSGTVEPGQPATTTVGTQTTAGNPQTVSLSASGLPGGATATFNPAGVTSGNSSTLTIATSASTPRGTYTVTVTGTGQTATHTATFTLTVGGGGPGPSDPPDISLASVKAHLQQFQTIATNNGGNRRSTGPGYTASVSYIEQKLQAAGYTVRRQNCGSTCSSGAGPNLIADWPGGDPGQVVMAGAHLDSVSAGPGINDNASGSAALLEVALTLAAKNPAMAKHVRFGWWSDEEQGLNGSEGYVASLSQAERNAIQVYHNYDMVGSPNGGYFINNINSTAAQHLKAFYDALNLQPEENTEGAGRSDDASFRAAGIPTSGVAAGASYTKTAAQAAKWGGTAGRAYDPCYHRSCDTTSNISDTILDRAADASAYAIWKLAVGSSSSRDFSLAANPSSGTVTAGQQATTQIVTQTTAGTPQTVNLSASGLPTGATATFNPAGVTSGNSSTLTIATSGSTPAGTYQVTVTGTGETGAHTTVFALTVQSTSPGRTFRNDTDYRIDDYSWIQSPITSTATGPAVSPVKVTVTSNHTCIEDLDIWLRGPNGTWYQVRAAGGSSCSVFGTRTWNVPVNQQAAGTWALYVEDVYANDTGVLDWWSVTV
ncbi:M28 family peptidase [Thermoactinospora rubra]|uniref:M28 family peptidase n=1 Tax=Thermoactinospora rubra TaxID=1088767 RepID=UPI001F0B1432|nr:M28 family peptidase [Thermoactinospora rubra]